MGLHLNAFRGEPAISGFAWHFTATHSSSGPFATDPGAALHERVPPASAWPWVDHPVSGRHRTTHRALSDSLSLRLRLSPRLATPSPTTRRLILQKARRHPPESPRKGSDRPEAHGFRRSFTPRVGVLFTVPSRYWFTIGRWRYLALGRGRPRFPPASTWRAVLTHRTTARRRAPPTGLSPPVAARSSGLQGHAGPPRRDCRPVHAAVQPRNGIAGRLCRRRGLGSSPFARRY